MTLTPDPQQDAVCEATAKCQGICHREDSDSARSVSGKQWMLADEKTLRKFFLELYPYVPYPEEINRFMQSVSERATQRKKNELFSTPMSVI